MDIPATVKYATTAHEGQVDKLGVPYIEHPKAVAQILVSSPTYRTLSAIDKQRAVKIALLHDILEDTSVTAEDLLTAGFDKQIVEAVILLTYYPHMSRDEYYNSILANELARVVKVADVIHNNLSARTSYLDTETRERLTVKYAKAKEILLLPSEVVFFEEMTE